MSPEKRLVSRDVLRDVLVEVETSLSLEPAHKSLCWLDEIEIGLWDAGPGADADVEVDEVFLVLRGAGTLTIADGDTIELAPGVLVRLYAGDMTTWTITERLRKLYLA